MKASSNYNAKLRSWVCELIAGWFRILENQNSMARDALKGCPGAIIRFKMDSLVKHPSACLTLCCPSCLDVRTAAVEIASMLHIVESGSPEIPAQNEYTRKFPFKHDKGEESSCVKNSIYVVVLWAQKPCENPAQLYDKCKLYKTQFNDTEQFRIHCCLPPLSTKLEDCIPKTFF